jgi:hypothetical protein
MTKTKMTKTLLKKLLLPGFSGRRGASVSVIASAEKNLGTMFHAGPADGCTRARDFFPAAGVTAHRATRPERSTAYNPLTGLSEGEGVRNSRPFTYQQNNRSD